VNVIFHYLIEIMELLRSYKTIYVISQCTKIIKTNDKITILKFNFGRESWGNKVLSIVQVAFHANTRHISRVYGLF
jgi:hypothetical protein